MIRDLIKKADLILLAVLLIAGLAASFALARSGTDGGQVTIKSAGKTIGTYSLKENRTLLITKDGHISDCDGTDSQGETGYNILQIRDGKADMISADCHNHDCVNHRPISKDGENIICLPHKIVIQIEKEKGDDGYDSLAK
ncbi:MAG: NusG domain II-containing protein [Lachnospiraceae bacterium]|nr:NusG domain II-containing protein [Lachnospiraceae bacterium]